MPIISSSFCQQFKVFVFVNRLTDKEQIHRIKDVMESIENTGTYQLTEPELSFGAKLAWRNASRCIGRKQWLNLKVGRLHQFV